MSLAAALAANAAGSRRTPSASLRNQSPGHQRAPNRRLAPEQDDRAGDRRARRGEAPRAAWDDHVRAELVGERRRAALDDGPTEHALDVLRPVRHTSSRSTNSQ